MQETEEKLKETMHVLSMQRSKSDLDVRPPDAHGIGGPIHGAGMFREVTFCFITYREAHSLRKLAHAIIYKDSLRCKK